MTVESNDTGRLVYEKIGTGRHILFAFHGFGQDRKVFQSWHSDRYTIYAFDLFYHGESTRRNGSLSKKEWEYHIGKVIRENNIEKFHILGYSLGGRFAISTALSFPQQTEELILIAPDGVFLTIWFKLATTPGIRFLFKYLMLNPEKLEKLITLNEKRRLVNKYVSDFIKKELGSPENRKRVYISWNYFKTLGYRRKLLIQLFQKHQFTRWIIVGSKDHIIKPSGILPIIEKMGKFRVNVLEKKHHQLLDEEVADLITNRSKLDS